MTGRRGPPALDFVGETPEIPEAGICARPGVPAEPLARIKRALLSIKGLEHAAVLEEIHGIDGLIEAADGDYQPVREAMALMDLGPARQRLRRRRGQPPAVRRNA